MSVQASTQQEVAVLWWCFTNLQATSCSPLGWVLRPAGGGNPLVGHGAGVIKFWPQCAITDAHADLRLNQPLIGRLTVEHLPYCMARAQSELWDEAGLILKEPMLVESLHWPQSCLWTSQIFLSLTHSQRAVCAH